MNAPTPITAGVNEMPVSAWIRTPPPTIWATR